MWEPVLFTRNSGGLAPRKSDGAMVGGYHWYIPSEIHDHKPPLGHYTDLFVGVKKLQDGQFPPWIIDIRGKKVFIGEYLSLPARLNVDSEQYPFIRDGMRDIFYGYGFVGDLGKDAIPSFSDMKNMSAAWRQQLEHLHTKLNADVAESFSNPDYLRSFAKSMEDMLPDGNRVYGDHLWDQRAKDINKGQSLRIPVLVNAIELTPGQDWATFRDVVEVDGVKKNFPSTLRSAFPNSTSARPSTRWMERLEGSVENSKLSSRTSLQWGEAIATTCAVSLVASLAVGLWTYQHRDRLQKVQKLNEMAEPMSKIER